MSDRAEIVMLAVVIMILSLARLAEIWETYRRKYGQWLLFDGIRQRRERRHQ